MTIIKFQYRLPEVIHYADSTFQHVIVVSLVLVYIPVKETLRLAALHEIMAGNISRGK
jgi:hypothetical protein